MKLKTLLLATFLTTSLCGFGQTESKGVILISEENLISLIQKIRAKRDANFQQLQVIEKSTDKNIGILKVEETPNNRTTDLKDINAKLLTLDYDLKYLTYLLETQRNAKPNTDYIVTSPNQSYYNINSERLNWLQKEIELLKMVAENQSKEENLKKPVSLVEINTEKPAGNLVELAKESPKNTPIDSTLSQRITTSSVDTIYVNNKNQSNYNNLKNAFGNYIEKVYFKNNSSKIEEIQKLQKSTKILKDNEKLDVYLKGYASNKGNAAYNQNLSFLRTETVKKQLISEGIHPSRILSQNHGIDYNQVNEGEARRVEISFIIRN